jgi:hypothetical protein
VAGVQRSNKLFGGLVCDFLDLFCFHFRSPVRGFGSLTSGWGTKGPRCRRTETDESGSRSERQRA